MMLWYRAGTIRELLDFHAGDVVRHKVSHERVVIINFHLDRRGQAKARVSEDFSRSGEFTCFLAELEPAPAPDAPTVQRSQHDA